MRAIKQLKKFKILVGVPHNEVKNYCFDDFLSRITNLTYSNYDILIADNSKTNKNKKKIIRAGVQSVYIKPKKKSNQRYIMESHEYLRRAALSGGYDFLLHLEDDIFPPLDIIERLLVHQKPIVSAPYFINHGHESHLMIQRIEENGDIVRHTVREEQGFDFLGIDGSLKKVYACGLGCMLIHRSVLERVPFRYIEGVDAHPDTFYATDLHAQNIPTYLDTSIICEHRNSSWNTVLDAIHLGE